MREKLHNITFLRILATVFVVLGHSMIIYQSNWNVYEPAIQSSFFNNIKMYINVIQMPLFISISGYLYYFLINEKKKIEKFHRFIKKKFERLLIPYIVISLIYFIPIRILLGFKEYKGFNLIKSIITVTNIGHLWYLVMLFNVFIIIFVLLKYIKDDKLIIFISLILYFISTGEPAKLEIRRTLFYVIFFMTGYYIRKYKKINISITQSVVLFVIHLCISIGFIIYIDTIGSNFTLIGKIMFLLANIIGLIAYYELANNFIRDPKVRGVIDSNLCKSIDTNSLGIYLFHEPIIYILYSNLGGKHIRPVVLVAICFTTSIVISILIINIIRKLKIGTIIGEYKQVTKKKINVDSISL